MDYTMFVKAFNAISETMAQNKEYLSELDAQNGDGDLGLSMDNGYRAVAHYAATANETDLGRLMMQCAGVFNEAAPSSLGTITAFGMMGMAKALRGKQEITLAGLADAMMAGVTMIMEKAKSKPGEKTILDALYPGAAALAAHADEDSSAFEAAAGAAAQGSESTRAMRSVHGRAAYYGDKSIGLLDGGSVVGRLIFEALCRTANA